MNAGLPSDADSVREWVQSLDEQEARSCLETLVKGQLRIHAALQEATAGLGKRLDRALGNPPRRAIPEAHLPVKGVPPPVGKTAQVARAMGQNARTRVWTARELHEALTGYGWAGDDEGDYASLLSTLSRMVKDGSIHRVERGLYSIAPAEDVYANLAAMTGQTK